MNCPKCKTDMVDGKAINTGISCQYCFSHPKIVCNHKVAKSLPTPSNHCKFWNSKDDSVRSNSTNETAFVEPKTSPSWNTPEPSCYGGSSNADSNDTFKSGGGGDFSGGGASGDW